jgi:hypothetical protein
MLSKAPRHARKPVRVPPIQLIFVIQIKCYPEGFFRRFAPFDDFFPQYILI